MSARAEATGRARNQAHRWLGSADLGLWYPVMVAVGLTFAGWLGGCSSTPEGPVLDDQLVTAACGRCIFGLPEAERLGCPWAVEVQGRRYLVQGEVPHGHQNHAPDGICNMPRKARVSGRVRGDRFIATRFALEPATDVPAAPRFTEDDVHAPQP